MENKYIVDTNFLLSLVLSTHPNHSISRDFFLLYQESSQFIICRSVQISFLRLLTQKLDPNYKPLSNKEALIELDKIMKIPNFIFLQETENDLNNWTQFAVHKFPSPHLWMDAYLAAFAIAGGLKFVSLDKDFIRLQSRGLKLELLSKGAEVI